MPREMFGDVVEPSIKLGSQKWYTVPLSILAHVVLFGAVIIIPLDGHRRAADAADDDGVRGPAAAATTTPAAASGRGGATQGQPPTPANPNAAPIEAPKEIARELPPTTGVAEGVPGGVEGGVPGGSIGGVVGGLPAAPPPPPPPPTQPVRVGGNIKTPTKVQRRQPGLPAHRAIGARAGRRHHRGDDRSGRPGQGCESSAVDPAPRPGGARRSQAVAVHANAAQRRPGAGHHDRHGELHAAVSRSASTPRGCGDRCAGSTLKGGVMGPAVCSNKRAIFPGVVQAGGVAQWI